jgi:hypothetical protein
MNIVDATADVGVNMMAFMRKFGHVDAIEQNNSSILKHNIDLFTIENKLSFDRFQIYQGNYNDVIKSENIKKNIIFFEPQPQKQEENDNIKIDDLTIEEVVLNMLKIFPFVVVKLPLRHRELFERNEDAVVASSYIRPEEQDIRPIFKKKYSKTQVIMFHNHDLHNYISVVEEPDNKEKNEINTIARMDAEKLGWYLYNDMTSGPVFGFR